MWDTYLTFMIELIKEAGEMIKPNAGRSGKQVQKLKKDLVTDMDLAVERLIVERIREKYPEHRIFSEEMGELGVSGDFEWVIDPIDGTVNYSRGLPLYGISIALAYKDEPVVAAIALPAFDELFWAVKGGGAFLDGKQIRVREVEPSDAFVSFGDFDKEGNAEQNNQRIALLGSIINDVYRIRMVGSAAISLPYIADGRLDAAIYWNPNRYDVLGGELMLTEAGAMKYTINGWTVYASKAVAAYMSERLSSI
jgi:myo-inositol-1(or 4)-monophosphatase